MSLDPIDQLGERLFEIAREEPPPHGAEQRALEAAQRVARSRLAPLSGAWRGTRPKLLLLAAALALIGGLNALLLPGRPPSSISREPLGLPRLTRTIQPAVVPQPSAPATASVEVRLLPRATPAPVRSSPVTLSDELELLKVAQNALASGNTDVALQTLDRYDHALTGNKKLQAEATLLRVETLSRAGRTQAAAELASRFVAENPTSPLVDRARSFIREGK